MDLQVHSWVPLNLEIGSPLAWCQDLRPSQNDTHLAYTLAQVANTPGPGPRSLRKVFIACVTILLQGVYVLVLSL